MKMELNISFNGEVIHIKTCFHSKLVISVKLVFTQCTLHAVIPMLVALQVDTQDWPPYASMLLMEVYEISSGSGHAVRLVYNGKVLKLPFCSGEEGVCDYKDFASYMATVTPTDPSKQCTV